MKYERYKNMNKLNTMFLTEYTALEELLNAKYGVEGGGVELYIQAMNSASESKEKIGKWEEDYHTLSKCMHISSVLALNGNKLRKPQCTKQDIAWLKKFASRFEKQSDSLAKLEKYEAMQAKFKEKIDKVKPVARNVAIACGVALAVNALLSGKKDKNDK
jgi:hypothetical protein